MRYVEEIMARFALTPAEVGVLVFIRDVMHNNCVASCDQLRETIGLDWYDVIERLSALGVLSVTKANAIYQIKIVAPGDRKRHASREAAKKRRKESQK